MADDEVDVEGEFDLKSGLGEDFYDTNELPSKSANLLPEFTSPAWMLEQGWSLDSCMDEKSKATIEKMLLEEQQYMCGRKTSRYLSIKKNVLLVTAGSSKVTTPNRCPWTQEEKNTFLQGLGIFGRSWSKIASLIPTRTNLQVKNYAQQYMKNIAKKKAEVEKPKQEQETLKSLIDLPLHVGNNTSLASTVASVTTGQPTITTASKNKLNVLSTKISSISLKKKLDKSNKQAKKKNSSVNRLDNKSTKGKESVKGKPLNTEKLYVSENLLDVKYSDTVNIINSKSHRKRSNLNLIDSALNGLSNHNNDIGKSGSSKETYSSDEEVEVDIDIENDDEENQVLQSRSASPSSVYEQLLKSAHILGDNFVKDVNKFASLEYSKENCLDKAVSDDDKLSCSQNGSLKTEEDNSSNETFCPLDSPCDDGNSTDRLCEVVEEEQTQSQAIVTSSGEVVEFDLPQEEKILIPSIISEEEKILIPSIISEEEKILIPSIISEEEKILIPSIISEEEKILIPSIISEEEKILIPSIISEEEKKIHFDFFDGRPLKTPERYLKIRNYIIDCWLKCKPNYLNKTCIRSGLKNCGDVNCIGRIHSYLECIGAINFGCDQVAHRSALKSLSCGSNSRIKGHGKDAVSSMLKSETTRCRKRRIRNDSGLWVDEKELEGKTIEHKNEQGEKKTKSSRHSKLMYDPFKLVPCLKFTEDNPAPCKIEMFNTAMAIMDIHAHVSKTEVIGMLGGQFCSENGLLTISIAVPCKSMSTGMQCEMDPVSQTLASEQIEDVGMSVVGWYHSHPTFNPNPSVRDIETQQKFQYWFSKGGSHFVGVIISPYSRSTGSIYSEINCLTISNNHSQEYLCNVPYKFDFTVVYHTNKTEILSPARELAEKYSNYMNRVQLSCSYKSSLGLTCLSKMLQSVRRCLDPPTTSESQPSGDNKSEIDNVMNQLEQIFRQIC